MEAQKYSWPFGITVRAQEPSQNVLYSSLADWLPCFGQAHAAPGCAGSTMISGEGSDWLRVVLDLELEELEELEELDELLLVLVDVEVVVDVDVDVSVSSASASSVVVGAAEVVVDAGKVT